MLMTMISNRITYALLYNNASNMDIRSHSYCGGDRY